MSKTSPEIVPQRASPPLCVCPFSYICTFIYIYIYVFKYFIYFYISKYITPYGRGNPSLPPAVSFICKLTPNVNFSHSTHFCRAGMRWCLRSGGESSPQEKSEAPTEPGQRGKSEESELGEGDPAGTEGPAHPEPSPRPGCPRVPRSGGVGKGRPPEAPDPPGVLRRDGSRRGQLGGQPGGRGVPAGRGPAEKTGGGRGCLGHRGPARARAPRRPPGATFVPCVTTTALPSHLPFFPLPHCYPGHPPRFFPPPPPPRALGLCSSPLLRAKFLFPAQGRDHVSSASLHLSPSPGPVPGVSLTLSRNLPEPRWGRSEAFHPQTVNYLCRIWGKGAGISPVGLLPPATGALVR